VPQLTSKSKGAYGHRLQMMTKTILPVDERH